jgi:uncharacterized membrane protein (DUF441 family)
MRVALWVALLVGIVVVWRSRQGVEVWHVAADEPAARD